MDKHKAKDWREVRRRRAWELKQLGWKQCDIAEALGVTEGAVSQWLKAARAEGAKGLAARKRSGRPPQLTDEQRQKIPELLVKGAEAHGFRGDLWTRSRVAARVWRDSLATACGNLAATMRLESSAADAACSSA